MWIFRLFPWWIMLALSAHFGNLAWQNHTSTQYTVSLPAPVALSIDTISSTGSFVSNQEVAILARLDKTFVFQTGDSASEQLTMLPLVGEDGTVRLILQSRRQSEQGFKTYLKQNTNREGWIEVRGWFVQQRQSFDSNEEIVTLKEEGFVVAEKLIFVEPFWGNRVAAYQARQSGIKENTQITGAVAAFLGLIGLIRFFGWRRRVRAKRALTQGSQPKRAARSATPTPTRPTAQATASLMEPIAATATKIPKTPRATPVAGMPGSTVIKTKSTASKPVKPKPIKLKVVKPKRQPTPEEVVAKAFGKPVRKARKKP